MVDASVAIKWVVEEQGTAEALALRLHRLCGPDLLVADYVNTHHRNKLKQVFLITVLELISVAQIFS